MRRLLIRKLSMIAFSATVLAGCSSPPGQLRHALDVNGDGLCDYQADGAPPKSADQAEPLVVAAPYDLALRVSLAAGFTPPGHGRVALVALVPTPGSSNQDLEELFTAELPGALPAAVALRLDTPADAVRERVRGWAADPGIKDVPAGVSLPPSSARLDAYVIVYDDANGNGHVDLGKVYGPRLEASGGGGALGTDDAVWRSYTVAKDAWTQQYGQVDFLGLSSPSDAHNEVLSVTSVTVVWNDAKAVYEIENHHTDCNHQQRNGETCLACTSGSVPLDPQGTSAVITWSLDRVR